MDRQSELLAHFDRGTALYKGGQVDEAIAEFQAALKVDPRHAPSHYNLALRLESKGRNAEAAAEFEAFLACADAEGRKLEPAVRARIETLRRMPATPPAPNKTLTMGPGASAGGGTLSLDGGDKTRTLGGVGEPAAAPPGVSWTPGQVVDGLYEVREVLGEGGFGMVHKVTHRGWDMELAVKAPLARKVASRHALESFVQEANAWVGLGLHPNIVTCFFVRVMGVPRIFIEYMAGGSLADWLGAGRVKGERAALDCAVQISRAMEYVHRRGLVHRDLKPGNCLMTADGTLKVTDFGLVHVGEEETDLAAPRTPGAKIERVKSATATATGRLGTPEYMAPEQWTDPRTAGKAADIWAFGAMLYELLTGKKPFAAAEGEPVDAFYARLLGSGWAYENPRAFLPELSALIVACLNVDPAKRPPDFKGLTFALEAAYAKLAGHAYPREAAKETPVRADTLVNQGVSMADLGRVEEALRLFGEALKLDPVHAGATYDQGLVLAKLAKGDAGGLVARLSALKRGQARDWAPAYLLGLAYALQGDGKEAARALSDAAALSRENAFIRQAQAGQSPPDFFVVLPKGTERAQKETTAFRVLMDRAREIQSKGDFEKAYEEVQKARAVAGYERAEEALALTRDLGAKAVRTGLKGGWQKNFFPGSEGARELAFVAGRLESFHAGGTVRTWDIETARLLSTEGGGLTMEAPRSARTSDGRFDVQGKIDGTLVVVEVGSGKVVMETKGHGGEIVAVLLSPDGNLAYTAGPDGVRRWELDWEYSFPTSIQNDQSGLLSTSREPEFLVWAQSRPRSIVLLFLGLGIMGIGTIVVIDRIRPQSARETKSVTSVSRVDFSGQALLSMPEEANGASLVNWVQIPGGTFMMGSAGAPPPNEKPVHQVQVRMFHMAKAEVTNGQYTACVKAGACTPLDARMYLLVPELNGDNLPVQGVTWDQAWMFARWVGGRLPSEAEWEFAARSGGKGQTFPWGDEPATCALAVMFDGAGKGGCRTGAPQPPCSRPRGSTEQGLCDMAGNVCEWTQDWYHDSYDGAPSDGTPWENSSGANRVVRGGGSYDSDLRTTKREAGRNGIACGIRPVR